MQLPNASQPKPTVAPQIVTEHLEPHEKELLRKQELLKKVHIIRERLAQNRGMVDGMNPNKAYVWVNISDNRQIEYQSTGYELCKDPNIKSKWKQSDNTHKRGDAILYEIDKDLHEALDLDAQLRAVEAVEGAREGFKAVAAQFGVPTYTPGKPR